MVTLSQRTGREVREEECDDRLILLVVVVLIRKSTSADCEAVTKGNSDTTSDDRKELLVLVDNVSLITASFRPGDGNISDSCLASMADKIFSSPSVLPSPLPPPYVAAPVLVPSTGYKLTPLFMRCFKSTDTDVAFDTPGGGTIDPMPFTRPELCVGSLCADALSSANREVPSADESLSTEEVDCGCGGGRTGAPHCSICTRPLDCIASGSESFCATLGSLAAPLVEESSAPLFLVLLCKALVFDCSTLLLLLLQLLLMLHLSKSPHFDPTGVADTFRPPSSERRFGCESVAIIPFILLLLIRRDSVQTQLANT
mmetsp:Transcript_1928/g.5586  ORF Transcript_1928/g.5586 Transcript_1928/m.5586 type:complete len:314 (-) Transcript_1928:187-1128(-)